MFAAQQTAAKRIKPLPVSALRSLHSNVLGLKITANPARPEQIPRARFLVISSDKRMRAPIATHKGVV
jgi:hypothetical protein